MKFIEIDAVIKMLEDNQVRTRNYEDEICGLRAIQSSLKALRRAEVPSDDVTTYVALQAIPVK